MRTIPIPTGAKPSLGIAIGDKLVLSDAALAEIAVRRKPGERFGEAVRRIALRSMVGVRGGCK